MHLYSLTLRPPSSVTQAVITQVLSKKSQEILIAHGQYLSLYRLDTENGRLVNLLTFNTFSQIRQIYGFRVYGSDLDLVLVTSDSGKLAVLQYDDKRKTFVKAHLETFGKSGMRRVVPGQYLAVDPKGRACMVASAERNKLVYVLNRDSSGQTTISSPLEAHRPRTFVYTVVGLDVDYENPMFASIESDYAETSKDPNSKHLVYYELDLGLNHVVRKGSSGIPATANYLIPVPGSMIDRQRSSQSYPGGVLVCSKGLITYCKHDGKSTIRVPIPKRFGTEDSYIVSGTVHVLQGSFFFLLQNEYGDLFRLTMMQEGNEAVEMTISYFDTVPQAVSIGILKAGYLFVAAEGSASYVYQFERLEAENAMTFSSDDFSLFQRENFQECYFTPLPLSNLSLVDNIPSLAPLTDSKVSEVSYSDIPELLTVSGTGHSAILSIVRNAIKCSALVSSELPGYPTGVFTTKLSASDTYDRYIVLAFTQATLVLSIGESVEEVSDSGLDTGVETIGVWQMGYSSLVQVHAGAVRHVMASDKFVEWKPPSACRIVCASGNTQQLAIALSNGEIIYFETDEEGNLIEFNERRSVSGHVNCLSLGDVPEGKLRSEFLVVGADDQTVRVLSLNPEELLESLSVQSLSAAPSDVRVLYMNDPLAAGGSATAYVHIGMKNGIYVRTVVDTHDGSLSDTRTKFLGPRPVKFAETTVEGQRVLIALCSKTWLGYMNPVTGVSEMTPLENSPEDEEDESPDEGAARPIDSASSLSFAASFTSEDCPEGIVGIQGAELQILSVASLRENSTIHSTPLRYTPRRLVTRELQDSDGNDSEYAYIIESENGVVSPFSSDNVLVDGDIKHVGYPRKDGSWASCIQVVNATQRQVMQSLEFDDNEAAFIMTLCSFDSHGEEEFLVVGTAKAQSVMPMKNSAAYIKVYRFKTNATLELVHSTSVGKTTSGVTAMIPFQGRLLVAVGNVLRIYEMGQKQLLRKAETVIDILQNIVRLDTQGFRIVAGDVRESVVYIVYKPKLNLFIPFCDDILQRHATALTMLDYETVAGGDRFGNFWVVRCDSKASEESDYDDHATFIRNKDKYLNGTPFRCDTVASFFTGDMPVAIHKTFLVSGGDEVILWTGLQGTIGVFTPFKTKQDIEFFKTLEMEMREAVFDDELGLTGRDQLTYRGQYVPVKAVIDGDLCEEFPRLPLTRKMDIAKKLNRTIPEVEKKISELRTRSAY